MVTSLMMVSQASKLGFQTGPLRISGAIRKSYEVCEQAGRNFDGQLFGSPEQLSWLGTLANATWTGLSWPMRLLRVRCRQDSCCEEVQIDYDGDCVEGEIANSVHAPRSSAAERIRMREVNGL